MMSRFSQAGLEPGSRREDGAEGVLRPEIMLQAEINPHKSAYDKSFGCVWAEFMRETAKSSPAPSLAPGLTGTRRSSPFADNCDHPAHNIHSNVQDRQNTHGRPL